MKLSLLLFVQSVLTTVLISTSVFHNQDFELADRYIINHSEIAVSEMVRTGVPASIKLAQGMLESDWGRSDLATVANNHFGIKCGGSWTGKTFYKSDDDRDKNGNLIESCFRAFDETYESFIAHSDFLSAKGKSSRYGFLFELDPTDYKGWAKGLRSAGYATDKKYPSKLIQIIEKYELYRFDTKYINDRQEVAKTSKSRKTRKYENNKPSTTVATNTAASLETDKINRLKVVIGDGKASIGQIAEANRKNVKALLEYNEVFSDEHYIPKAGMAVYLQRKRSSHNIKGKQHHRVVEGETMAFIAHRYGMKLKSLYIKNRMPVGAEPIPGEKLNLYRTVSHRNKPKFTTDFVEDSAEELLFLDDPTLH